MPATALPPSRPRMAPDGAAAPGTDLCRGEQESRVELARGSPSTRQGAAGPAAPGCTKACGSASKPKGCQLALPQMEHDPLEKLLVLSGPLPGSSQRGSSFSVPDHCIRPRKFPGQEDGVHLGLSKHHGVWFRQHPLPKGGVWRVSTRLPVAWVLSQVGGWQGKGCLSTCRAGKSHPTELEPSTSAGGSQVLGSHPARAEQRALGTTSTDTGPGDSSNTFGII